MAFFSVSVVFFVFAAIVNGCAPSDGSIPTLSKEFDMVFLPSTAWTYFEPSEFGQAMTMERANRRFQNDIRGAIYESVDRLAPGLGAFKIDELSAIDISVNLDQTLPSDQLAELTNENATVVRQGVDYFNQKASAKLSSTFPLANNQWEAIANGVTLKLINDYDVSFSGDKNGIFLKN